MRALLEAWATDRQVTMTPETLTDLEMRVEAELAKVKREREALLSRCQRLSCKLNRILNVFFCNTMP